MKPIKQLIIEELNNVITEAVKVRFKGHQFVLKVDVNEDPNKKGIKVQFIPTTFGQLTPTEQDDIAIALGEKLETGLEDKGIRVERDRNLKDKTIIGFFIYIEYIDRIVRQALAGNEDAIEEPEEEL